MLEAILSLSSPVRWSLIALFITFALLFFEGSDMWLSRFTKGKPKVQRIFSYLTCFMLAVILFFGYIWLTYPTQDQTARELSEIKQIMMESNEQTNKSINDLTDQIQRLIVTLEANNVSTDTTTSK